MRKNTDKTQLGSVMIEALAMLALIAMVTPVLYKKSAERATELQDINAASELRAIVKGVDDYISSNYETIIKGGTVTNNCGGHTSTDFSDFGDADDGAGGAIDAKMEVDLEHFCEYLPYGVLTADASGNLSANKTRLFDSDYRVVFKLNGTSDDASGAEGVVKGQKVVTAFVITKPNQELQERRANSIASMIGGNGGVATSDSTIEGNMGVWSIGNTESEFGFKVDKSAVVAASIEGISAQNTKINLDEVLHRVKQNENPWLNAMETTLYMGLQNASVDKMNDIVNIGHLIVAAEENGGNANDRLYIAQGNINVANQVQIDDQGNITATANMTAGGNLSVDGSATIGTTLSAAAEQFKVEEDGSMSAAGGAFTVGADGATSALSYKTNDDKVKINIDNKSVFDEPMEVGSNENCTISGDTITGCALLVKGDLGVTNDLVIGNALNAKNLHARNLLTVGGDSSDSPQALKVSYESGKSTFDFGADPLGDNSVISAETGENSKFVVKNAKNINLMTQEEKSKIGMTDEGISILAGVSGEDANASIDMYQQGQIEAYASNEMKLDSNDIFLNYINDNRYGMRVAKSGDTNIIESVVQHFTVFPSSANYLTNSFFEIHHNEVDGNETLVKGMPMIVRDGTFYLQKDNKNNIVRIGENQSANSSQIDISKKGFLLREEPTGSAVAGENILKIDLDSSPSNSNYPIYVRKGAIELKSYEGGSVKDTTYENYVQADRFISNTTLPAKAFVNFDDSDATPSNAHYQINPAYTSVMHDIKLTTRGGARLSDILPDFINKGIYVVDNTYPANGHRCSTNGMRLENYRKLSRENKQSIASCTSYSDEASAWAGFVPTPTCPPGYVKVITLTPTSFQVAEAGNMENDPQRGSSKSYMPGDINPQYYPYLIVGETPSTISGSTPSVTPNPLYFQKNTWLKSFAAKSFKSGSGSAEEGADSAFEGWDVGLGFVYPYKLFQSYIDELGINYKNALDSSECDTGATSDELNRQCIYWNLFPVRAGTLEGYATVYCYFDRRRSGLFNPALVDTTYDQMENFRGVQVKNNTTYTNRLNDESGVVTSEW